MNRNGVLIIFLITSLFVVSGCAGKITNPNLLGVAEMADRGDYEGINREIEQRYIGLGEKEVKELLGDPDLTDPKRLGENTDLWVYRFKPDKVLGKKGWFWNKEVRKKKHLLLVGFEEGIVRGVQLTDPEVMEVQDGWLKARLKNPFALAISLALFAL
jgi:hypothetical protein